MAPLKEDNKNMHSTLLTINCMRFEIFRQLLTEYSKAYLMRPIYRSADSASYVRLFGTLFHTCAFPANLDRPT